MSQVKQTFLNYFWRNFKFMDSFDTTETNKESDENEKDDYEYFKRSKPEVFILLSGFSEKTNVVQILNFLRKDFSNSPVEDGVYGVLFLTTSDGCSTGKAVIRLKSVQYIEEVLKKQGRILNNRPITIKPISKSEGLALLYSLRNRM